MPEPRPDPPTLGGAPVPEHRPLTGRERFRESAPLAAVGLAFLAGAALASIDHLRVLSSEFPLWILLALDGGVAVVAGGMAFFVAEPDRPIDDDPAIVRVPRAEWESLLRRLDIVARAPGPRGAVPEWSESHTPGSASRGAPPAPESLPTAGGPALGSAAAVAPASAAPAESAPPAPPAMPSKEDLRREMGWLELQGFAESAVSTGENLGAEELRRMLDASTADLARIGEELGRPPEPGEPAEELIFRLLRDEPATDPKGPTRWRPPELERLSKRLTEILPKTATAADRRRSVTDEFEALLRELETTQTPPARRKGAGPGPEAPPK